LYMFGAVDPAGYTGSCAAKGQYWLRKAMTTLYKPGADMFSGDEDNGQMSAWYIMSSLGLYSLSPGSSEYALGSPLFAKATISLSNTPGESRTLVVTATNNSPANVYVQEVTFNGTPIVGTNFISHFEVMKGGELNFVMGPSPKSTK
jgi:putative alpha-1,2-mannosidase